MGKHQSNKDKMQNPKAKTLECCGLNRHLNACMNMLKTQDESLRFRLDRPANVAVTRPLNKAVSQSGEATPKGYQPKR
jgi:hypothetical protein